jgi:hypothetical protein
MNLDEIKEVLWKLSVEFVKDNNTMLGRYTYQDIVIEVFMAARRRNIIGDLQLFDAIEKEETTEAVFMFSPNYLNREDEMLFGGMGEIKWKLILPKAVNRFDIKDADIDWEEVENEILEKISISKIDIINFVQEFELDIKDFISSFSNS